MSTSFATLRHPPSNDSLNVDAWTTRHARDATHEGRPMMRAVQMRSQTSGFGKSSGGVWWRVRCESCSEVRVAMMVVLSTQLQELSVAVGVASRCKLGPAACGDSGPRDDGVLKASTLDCGI